MATTRTMHQFIRPMLAEEIEKPFSDADWLFEIKWDGYRAIAECGKQTPLLYSRNGLSFQTKYALVYNELKKIKVNAIIDGEIVAFDEKGNPSFQKLQLYDENPNTPLQYYVFDLLFYKGKNITQKPLTERKKLLQTILPKSNIIQYSAHIEEYGTDFFKEIKARKLEGMMAKKKDGIYIIGKRTRLWLKVKNQHTDEVVVIGYTEPRGNRHYFGALILSRYKNGKLVYAGHTGTGFSERMLQELYKTMQPLKLKASPFKEPIPVNNKPTWIRPILIAQIRYTELTKEGIMRHPVFLGLRTDKTIEDMKQDASSKTKNKAENSDNSKTVSFRGIKVELSNLNKIFWPDENLTKGHLINYYNSIYKYIIPYLKNRPESLKRNPNGIADEGFFQKDAKEIAPDWADTITLYSESAEKDIEYFICNHKAALLFLANLGCIELNPWNSTIQKLDYPDYMILDIDPSSKNTFDDVITVALICKDILTHIQANSYCKTTGSSGVHIYVPLGKKYTYDECRMFAELLAQKVVQQAPELCTIERSLSKRSANKVYIDYLQNKKGQTLACVYSARPRKGATVSMPLHWKEVKKGLHPSQFTIVNVPKLLEKRGDIFRPVLQKGISLQSCLKRLEQL